MTFLFGTAVGSFLNVVILRLNRESIRGRSHCPHCRKTLAWFELLPIVSFLIQGAKCRSCQKPISWQYPTVEFLCGTLFFAVFLRFTLWSPFGISSSFVMSHVGWWVWPLIALWLIYAALLLAISVYDAKWYLIPDALMFPLTAFAFLGAVYQHALWQLHPPLFPQQGVVFMGPEALLLGRSSGSIAYFLLGAAAAVFLIGGIWFFSGGRAMGFGDVKLALFMGLALGWPDILGALILAFVVGTLFSLPMIIARKKHMKSMLPFGPFLVFGTLAIMVTGDWLAAWYFRIFPNLFL